MARSPVPDYTALLEEATSSLYQGQSRDSHACPLCNLMCSNRSNMVVHVNGQHGGSSSRTIDSAAATIAAKWLYEQLSTHVTRKDPPFEETGWVELRKFLMTFRGAMLEICKSIDKAQAAAKEQEASKKLQNDEDAARESCLIEEQKSRLQIEIKLDDEKNQQMFAECDKYLASTAAKYEECQLPPKNLSEVLSILYDASIRERLQRQLTAFEDELVIQAQASQDSPDALAEIARKALQFLGQDAAASEDAPDALAKVEKTARKALEFLGSPEATQLVDLGEAYAKFVATVSEFNASRNLISTSEGFLRLPESPLDPIPQGEPWSTWITNDDSNSLQAWAIARTKLEVEFTLLESFTKIASGASTLDSGAVDLQFHFCHTVAEICSHFITITSFVASLATTVRSTATSLQEVDQFIKAGKNFQITNLYKNLPQDKIFGDSQFAQDALSGYFGTSANSFVTASTTPLADRIFTPIYEQMCGLRTRMGELAKLMATLRTKPAAPPPGESAATPVRPPQVWFEGKRYSKLQEGWGATANVFKLTHAGEQPLCLRIDTVASHGKIEAAESRLEWFRTQVGDPTLFALPGRICKLQNFKNENGTNSFSDATGVAELGEYFDEGDLVRAVFDRESDHLPVKELAKLCEELVTAVKILSTAGGHGDLKPQNVYLRKELPDTVVQGAQTPSSSEASDSAARFSIRIGDWSNLLWGTNQYTEGYYATVEHRDSESKVQRDGYALGKMLVLLSTMMIKQDPEHGKATAEKWKAIGMSFLADGQPSPASRVLRADNTIARTAPLPPILACWTSMPATRVGLRCSVSQASGTPSNDFYPEWEKDLLILHESFPLPSVSAEPKLSRFSASAIAALRAASSDLLPTQCLDLAVAHSANAATASGKSVASYLSSSSGVSSSTTSSTKKNLTPAQRSFALAILRAIANKQNSEAIMADTELFLARLNSNSCTLDGICGLLQDRGHVELGVRAFLIETSELSPTKDVVLVRYDAAPFVNCPMLLAAGGTGWQATKSATPPRNSTSSNPPASKTLPSCTAKAFLPEDKCKENTCWRFGIVGSTTPDLSDDPGVVNVFDAVPLPGDLGFADDYAEEFGSSELSFLTKSFPLHRRRIKNNATERFTLELRPKKFDKDGTEFRRTDSETSVVARFEAGIAESEPKLWNEGYYRFKQDRLAESQEPTSIFEALPSVIGNPLLVEVELHAPGTDEDAGAFITEVRKFRPEIMSFKFQLQPTSEPKKAATLESEEPRSLEDPYITTAAFDFPGVTCAPVLNAAFNEPEDQELGSAFLPTTNPKHKCDKYFADTENLEWYLCRTPGPSETPPSGIIPVRVISEKGTGSGCVHYDHSGKTAVLTTAAHMFPSTSSNEDNPHRGAAFDFALVRQLRGTVSSAPQTDLRLGKKRKFCTLRFSVGPGVISEEDYICIELPDEVGRKFVDQVLLPPIKFAPPPLAAPASHVVLGYPGSTSNWLHVIFITLYPKQHRIDTMIPSDRKCQWKCAGEKLLTVGKKGNSGGPVFEVTEDGEIQEFLGVVSAGPIIWSLGKAKAASDQCQCRNECSTRGPHSKWNCWCECPTGLNCRAVAPIFVCYPPAKP